MDAISCNDDDYNDCIRRSKICNELDGRSWHRQVINMVFNCLMHGYLDPMYFMLNFPGHMF